MKRALPLLLAICLLTRTAFAQTIQASDIRAFLNNPWQKVSPPPDAILVEY